MRDQIHAPANLSQEPIGKAQGRARRCDENVNLSVCLSQTGKVKSIISFTKDKNKTKVQGRVNDLLLHILKEMGLKLGQESIDVQKSSVDFLRPSRQMYGCHLKSGHGYFPHTFADSFINDFSEVRKFVNWQRI